MKKNWIAIAMAMFLLVAAIPSFAQNLVVRATCPDAVEGVIPTNTEFSIIVEMYNDYGAMLGGSLPLVIYSPDASITELAQQVVVGGNVVHNLRGGGDYATSNVMSLNGWDAIFSLLKDYTGVSWDGSLPDTINWSGATLGGYNADADFVARMEFSFTSGSTEGTICIDSCSIPSTPAGVYDWLWDDPGANFNNSANSFGPYCWDIQTVAGVNEIGEGDLLPTDYELSQNYPNPFNPETKIEFAIKEHSHVNISIFNILGQKVSTLADREFEAGYYQADWNGTDDNGTAVASGMYFYRLEANNFTDTKKMIMLK